MDVSEVVVGKRTYVKYGPNGAWHIKMLGAGALPGTQYFHVEGKYLRDALDEISRLHDVIQTYSDQYER